MSRFHLVNMTDSNVLAKYLSKSLDKENIENYTIEITGTTAEGDNYVGNITFVQVKGHKKLSSQESNQTKLDLVVKTSRKNLSSNDDFAKAYQRENLFYNSIIPSFQKFQKEKNVADIFHAVPKCYDVLEIEDTSVLIFDDMRKKGYILHPKDETMNINHIKDILEKYAKFHAISFVMCDQNREMFNKLTENLRSHMLKSVVEAEPFFTILSNQTAKVETLLKKVDYELYRSLESYFKKGQAQTTLDILEMNVEEEVITHADCWNNNFLFKYEVSDIT